jgi:hypothetical protein
LRLHRVALRRQWQHTVVNLVPEAGLMAVDRKVVVAN